MEKPDTLKRILDAAEQLFAREGYHGTSFRKVAEAAGISVSLTQYHFPTKDALYEAVFARRILVINHDRLAKLDKVEAEARQLKRPVDLEGALQAFVEPTVLLARDKKSGGAQYAQLIAQLTNNPNEYARAVSRKYTDPIARQTMRVLREAVPETDSTALPWCYLFAVGAMISAISATGRVKLLSDGECDPDDVQRIVGLLVPFLSGGFERVAEITARGSKTPKAAKPRSTKEVSGGKTL